MTVFRLSCVMLLFRHMCGSSNSLLTTVAERVDAPFVQADLSLVSEKGLTKIYICMFTRRYNCY